MSHTKVPIPPFLILGTTLIILMSGVPAPLNFIGILIGFLVFAIGFVSFMCLFFPNEKDNHPLESQEKVEAAYHDFLTHIALMIYAKGILALAQSATLTFTHQQYVLISNNPLENNQGKTSLTITDMAKPCLKNIRARHDLNTPQMRLFRIFLEEKAFHALPQASAHDVMFMRRAIEQSKTLS